MSEDPGPGKIAASWLSIVIFGLVAVWLFGGLSLCDK